MAKGKKENECLVELQERKKDVAKSVVAATSVKGKRNSCDSDS